MTQRDIAKDKTYLETFKNGAAHVGIMTVPMVDMAQYWIAQYEASVKIAQVFTLHIDELRARISELEALLHPNNNPGAKVV